MPSTDCVYSNHEVKIAIGVEGDAQGESELLAS